MMDAALQYAHMGLRVIPLHGKRPYFESWTEVATTDDKLINKWWSQEPKANVGIATGAQSNIFVVDVDPRSGGEESIDTLFSRHGRFPSTWTDITGSGGTHYYFRYPAFKVGNSAGLYPGIDIRGDGGQVVAPPSIHPDTGRRYMWDGIEDPSSEPLAEAPLWLLELLAPKVAKEHFSVAAKIPHGVQHHTLVSLAGAMRRLGLTAEEIAPTLQRVNASRCEQPGPVHNIDKIAQSVMRYQPHDKAIYNQASTLWRLTREAEEKVERAKAKQTEQERRMAPIDGYTLFKKDLKPANEIIEGLLYNGLTILAGPPKSGKSWIVLGMAIGVACKGKFVSAKNVTAPGRVGYFALEESETRTASRLKMLCLQNDISLQNIEFHYKINPIQKGGLSDLEAYLERSHPTLVIIDTLTAFVTGDANGRIDPNVFQSEYRNIKALQELCIKYETAILVVHHTNKVGGGGIGAVAGTHGLTAAADSVWTLKKQPAKRALLEVTGREVEDQALLLQLDLENSVGWYLVEEGDDVTLSEERQEILELLAGTGPLPPVKIASELRKNGVTIRRLLQKLLANGLVSLDNGKYGLPHNVIPFSTRSWNDN